MGLQIGDVVQVLGGVQTYELTPCLHLGVCWAENREDEKGECGEHSHLPLAEMEMGDQSHWASDLGAATGCGSWAGSSDFWKSLIWMPLTSEGKFLSVSSAVLIHQPMVMTKS